MKILKNGTKDISGSNDIAEKHPEVVVKMNRIFEEQRIGTAGFPYGGVVLDYRPRDKYNKK